MLNTSNAGFQISNIETDAPLLFKILKENTLEQLRSGGFESEIVALIHYEQKLSEMLQSIWLGSRDAEILTPASNMLNKLKAVCEVEHLIRELFYIKFELLLDSNSNGFYRIATKKEEIISRLEYVNFKEHPLTKEEVLTKIDAIHMAVNVMRQQSMKDMSNFLQEEGFYDD